MRMKKWILSLALASCCAFGLGLAACDDSQSSSSSSDTTSNSSSSDDSATSYTVSFAKTEGVSFISETQSGATVDKDETVSFSLKISSFYEGAPIVTVNDTEIEVDDDGAYSFAVTQNSVVKVSGVQRAVGDLTGAGTSDDAYVINSVQDLLYMAERINAADSSYTGACYYLANDIDCEGTELDVIGDGSTDMSFFSGVFNGNNKTISNYTIETNNTLYVGFFGWVVADTSSTATSAIYNLTLENFEMTASMQDESMFCGALIGYSIGATVSQCNAYGEMMINGDKDYSTYAGGLIGLAQAAYLEETENSYNSCLAYCITDVGVTAGTGIVVAAGGLVGYAYSNGPDAVAYIVNCYSLGNVSGAIRAGGLVGILGQYTSVSSCYALGDVYAQSSLTDEVYDVLRYAYAGGLIGYGENDSIVADSFAIGETFAYAELGEEHAFYQGGIVGGKDAKGYVSVESEECVVFNSYYAVDGVDGDVKYTSESFQKNSLKLPAYDWIIVDGSYPTINREYNEETVFALTLSFGEYMVNDANTYILELQSHFPLTYLHLSEDIPEYIKADNESGSVNSYGYFFDETLTLRVPRCFVTTRDITLHAGFADNTEIAGTYYIQTATSKNPVTLTLNADGTFEYYDGGMTSMSAYVYNGSSILLQNARLARYLPVEYDIAVTELVSRFGFYNFMANVEADGSLTIYGGSHDVGESSVIYEQYFTLENPLRATKTEPTQNKANAFVGVWHSAQAIGYTLAFGQDNFTYNGKTNENGTYTVDGSVATLSTGKTVTLENGMLIFNGMTFYAKNSFKGSWINFDAEITLHLNGIDTTGVGSGELIYGENISYKIFYVAETNGGLDGYISLYSENQFIGCVELDQNTLRGYFYDPAVQTMTEMYFRICDAFDGDWISEDALFSIVNFNGLGNYNVNWGNLAEKGSIVINGENVEYTLQDKFNGSFTYDGVVYSISLDTETNTVKVTYGENETILERKDAYANLTLTDDNGNVYTFDGRGALGKETGKMTVTAADGSNTTVAYTVVADGSLILGDNAGTLKAGEQFYEYTLGGVSASLKIKNFFSNEWAIAQMYAVLTIGSFDLQGNVKASYPQVNGSTETVTYLDVEGKLIDDETLALEIPDGNKKTTLYLFAISDDEIAISAYESLSYGGYTVAAIKDELFGVWTSVVTSSISLIFEFDGLVNSSNTTAGAIQSQNGVGSSTQTYYYSRRENGAILLWSANTIGNQTSYRIVEWCEPTEKGAFVNEDGTKAFKLIEVDSLYQLTAYAENGEEWLFDGQGGVEVYKNDELIASYEYKVNSFNNNYTVDLTVTINGEEVSMRINYAGTKVLIETVED